MIESCTASNSTNNTVEAVRRAVAALVVQGTSEENP